MRKQYTMHRDIDDTDVGSWREHVTGLCEVLAADLRQRGLTPLEAPPLPPEASGVQGEILGPFRALCAFVMFPIVGWDMACDEAIIGRPCYKVRVDTLVEEPGV